MMTSDKGKNSTSGLSEFAILIIPGMKDRISNGKTRYEIFPTCRCSWYFLFLINNGCTSSIKIQVDAIAAWTCI